MSSTKIDAVAVFNYTPGNFCDCDRIPLMLEKISLGVDIELIAMRTRSFF